MPTVSETMTIPIELPETTNRRLDKLAAETGQSKEHCIVRALEEYLEDLDDYHLAAEAVKNPGKIYTSEEIERELGL